LPTERWTESSWSFLRTCMSDYNQKKERINSGLCEMFLFSFVAPSSRRGTYTSANLPIRPRSRKPHQSPHGHIANCCARCHHLASSAPLQAALDLSTMKVPLSARPATPVSRYHAASSDANSQLQGRFASLATFFAHNGEEFQLIHTWERPTNSLITGSRCGYTPRGNCLLGFGEWPTRGL